MTIGREGVRYEKTDILTCQTEREENNPYSKELNTCQLAYHSRAA
jgi:hypothetical protein